MARLWAVDSTRPPRRINPHHLMNREQCQKMCDALNELQTNTAMTTSQLIDQLVTQGGAIVSSGECSEMEIANAQATGRFSVRDDGMGFVRRTSEWLALQLAREKAHPNSDGRYSESQRIADESADGSSGRPAENASVEQPAPGERP